jgi:hypothetical protein
VRKRESSTSSRSRSSIRVAFSGCTLYIIYVSFSIWYHEMFVLLIMGVSALDSMRSAAAAIPIHVRPQVGPLSDFISYHARMRTMHYWLHIYLVSLLPPYVSIFFTASAPLHLEAAIKFSTYYRLANIYPCITTLF